jgi:hypothetical protein
MSKPHEMKKIIWLILAAMIVVSACHPKPAWKTRQGKKKVKSYNMHMNDSYKVKKYQSKKFRKKTNNIP